MNARNVRISWILVIVVLFAVGCSQKDKGAAGDQKTAEVPTEYRDKHMPEGGWTDMEAITAGRDIYEGRKIFGVNCGACHGVDGNPNLPGSTDFRNASAVNKWSDSYWFWRISEGMAGTAMTAWKGRLSEEAIWQVIAYSHTFSHKGIPEDHVH